MTKIFIGYTLDWTGPEVLSFHLTEEDAIEQQKHNQYMLIKSFEYPEDPLICPEKTLDFIHETLWTEWVEAGE